MMDSKFHDDLYAVVADCTNFGYTFDTHKFVSKFRELAYEKYSYVVSSGQWPREAYTDFARLIRDFTDDHIFAKFILSRWFAQSMIIVPDVRHPAELAHLIEKRHAIAIRVEADLEQRKTACQLRKKFDDNDLHFFDHPTETALDDYTGWDRKVYNDLTDISCIENIADGIIKDFILPNYQEVNAL